MKVIIAGSRTLHHFEEAHYKQLCLFVEKFEKLHGKITLVVSGAATGPDKLGERWAKEHNVQIAQFKADWDRHGKAAGPIRNSQMGDYADAAIVMWDGNSNGAKHMYEYMKKHEKIAEIDIFQPIVHFDHNHKGTINVAGPLDKFTL